MSRSAFLLMSVLCLFLALAGFLVWAVLAGGYRTGVVIPAAVVLGVTVVGLRLSWARVTRRPGVASPDAKRSTWALAMFVLGALMGWLCGELIGFVLLPVLWVVIVPRARRQGLLPVTLPPFGLGLVLLPLFFLVVDEFGGFQLVLRSLVHSRGRDRRPAHAALLPRHQAFQHPPDPVIACRRPDIAARGTRDRDWTDFRGY